jgi:hypothetical protein
LNLLFYPSPCLIDSNVRSDSLFHPDLKLHPGVGVRKKRGFYCGCAQLRGVGQGRPRNIWFCLQLSGFTQKLCL